MYATFLVASTLKIGLFVLTSRESTGMPLGTYGQFSLPFSEIRLDWKVDQLWMKWYNN